MEASQNILEMRFSAQHDQQLPSKPDIDPHPLGG
jgi:hypothetical protein